MAQPLSKTNTLLNIRWPCQDSNSIIPPQLQGISGATINMAMIYAVNAIIKINELYNPFNRHLGITNIITRMNSNTGSKTATGDAAHESIGESASCSLNTL